MVSWRCFSRVFDGGVRIAAVLSCAAAALSAAPAPGSAESAVAGSPPIQLVEGSRAPATDDAGDAAAADHTTDVDTLLAAMRIGELTAIMADEGTRYATELRDEMFPERGAAGWSALLNHVYDPARMAAVVADEMARALDGADVAAMLGFFESVQGRRVIELEISARQALLDEAVEEASKAQLATIIAEEGPFLGALRDFVEANDLVETNVAGALNANYAFYQGLVSGGAFPEPMSDADMLADVWSQEGEIRAETEEWVYSYLAMAYRPLPVGELEAYTAFSLTGAGQALNAALFAAFDALFVEISRRLGVAAAAQLASEDL